MALKKRSEDDADPAIVTLAETAAGILAEIFGVDKGDLLDRPRPSGKLLYVRFVLFGILHFHFCFNERTGEVAQRSPATTEKNWRAISQKKVARALQRDRGAVSKGSVAIEEASAGDIGVSIALGEISGQIANVIAQAAAWRAALEQEMLEAAIAAAREEEAASRVVMARVEDAIAEDQAIIDGLPEKRMRCHSCYGQKFVRIHRLGGDPGYRAAWEAAEARAHSSSGFHNLDCRFCEGKGFRVIASPAGASAAAILGADGDF